MKKWIPLILGVLSFVYLSLMCVRQYSWAFVSSDSADFLMASTVWAVPQTYGYPLYITLGHLLNLLPGELAAKMTILLSALPASISVVVVYLTVLRMTSKWRWQYFVALTAALVLLGTAFFVTEATVTKGYALVAMFLALAFYAYIRNWRYRTVMFLGLGVAVHMLVAAIAFFWLLADRRWKLWIGKPLLVFGTFGFVPYLLIPLLMALDTPRFMAGSLSIHNLINYFSMTSRSIIGMISVFDAPVRIFVTTRILIMSLGLAIIALCQNIYKPLTRPVAILVATVLFQLWYVVTCLDAQTWTYLAVAAPAVAVLVGLGLSTMQKAHTYAIATCAVVLVGVNGFMLNANLLDQRHPQGQEYYTMLQELPDGAVVVTEPGPYSLGLFYAIVKGKDLVPLIYPYIEEPRFSVADYAQYLETDYGVKWTSTLDGVQECLEENRPVYFITTDISPIRRCFETSLREPEVLGVSPMERITALTGLPPEEYVVEAKTND